MAKKTGVYVCRGCGIADAIDTQDLLAAAVERGVAFVPGQAFAVGTDHHRALRLSFVTTPPDQLVEGVRRLAVAVRDRR